MYQHFFDMAEAVILSRHCLVHVPVLLICNGNEFALMAVSFRFVTGTSSMNPVERYAFDT